jgi:hypothetical protein
MLAECSKTATSAAPNNGIDYDTKQDMECKRRVRHSTSALMTARRVLQKLKAGLESERIMRRDIFGYGMADPRRHRYESLPNMTFD